MKKSLSLLLAFAMVFSLFATVVSAADDTLTTQQKFEALKAKGIFAGKGADQDPALDDDMTRAEGARIIALLADLDPDSQVVTEKPFPDVEIDAWYAEEVQAVAGKDYFVGDDNGNFNPNDKFTVQQLAIVVAKVIGLEPVEDAEVDGAASWAAGYIQALIDNGVDFPTNYEANATRAQLVEATFIADQVLNPVVPAEQSVVSLAATGAKKLTVGFAKAVEDASELKFTIKKGAANVAVASEDAYTWSDDKKSVVILLDSKMTEGTYTVTVEPATEDDPVVNDGTKEVKVDNEKIVSININSASEYIAKSDENVISFDAINQYNEKSDLTASRFDLITGNVNALATPVTDKQEVNLDVSHGSLVKDSRVALTIVAPGASAQATQVYIIGDAPSAYKIETGDLKLDEDKERLTAGDEAVLELTVYDQYGNKMTKNADIISTTTLISTRGDVIENNVTGLQINAQNNLDIKTKTGITRDTDVLLTLIPNGSGTSVNYTVKVYAPKSPANVEFGEFTDTVAAGDGTIYIPLIVTDQFDEKLSAKEISDAASQFTVYSTNSNILTDAEIHTTADANQGKLAVDISSTSTGNASVTVMINSTGKSVSYPISVQDPRVPNRIVVDSAPAAKALPNAVAKVKYKVQDQYGKNITANNADYRVDFATDDPKGAFTTPAGSIANVFSGVSDGVEFNLAADQGVTGTMKFTAKLVKDADNSTVSSVTVTVEAIKADAANDLTYEVDQVGKLYVIPAGTAPAAVTKMSKTIGVKAKDSSGKDVALPASVVKSVYSSDEDIADINGTDVVFGKDKGTATLTVGFEPAVGNVKIATQTVEVSDVKPYADSLTVKNATKANTIGALNGKDVWSGDVAGDIKLVDQYGIEYKNGELVDPDFAYLGVSFVVSNVKGGAVSINAAGKLSVGEGVESFTIQVYSTTNGKTATVNVTIY